MHYFSNLKDFFKKSTLKINLNHCDQYTDHTVQLLIMTIIVKDLNFVLPAQLLRHSILDLATFLNTKIKNQTLKKIIIDRSYCEQNI